MSEDQFDRLPDHLLLAIFNCVGEAKSLGRCFAVSLRFRTIAAQTDHVDCLISPRSDIRKIVFISGKPFSVVGRQFGASGVLSSGEISHHSPADVLKDFRQIHTLKIVVSARELLPDSSNLVMDYDAEFGSSLKRCAIFIATSIRRIPSREVMENPKYDIKDQSFCTNGGAGLRYAWRAAFVIAGIAATAKDFLEKNNLSEHRSLRSLEIAEVDRPGTLRMHWDQLEEFLTSPDETRFPALNANLWYAPRLELNSGYVIEGAKLMGIGPVDQVTNMEIDEYVAQTFGGQFREAAQDMLKRKSCHLDLKPF